MASIISAGTTSGTSLNLSGDTSGVLQLASNGSTTAVTIDTSQNVGIGTSPSATNKLQVSSAGTTRLYVENTANAVGVRLQTLSNAGLLQTDTNHPLTFATNNGAEAMRIDTSGALLVGTTTVYNTATTNVGFVGNVGSGISVNTTTSTNGATFQVFLQTGSLIGSISNNNNTGVLYNVTSDYRLKNNAVALTGAKDFVMALKPKAWDWYNDLGKGVGFLAHEFMEVAKYSGHGEKDAVDSDGKPIYQTIQASSTEVMANIVALIQEQQTMIQELKAELDATKAEVQALKGVA